MALLENTVIRIIFLVSEGKPCSHQPLSTCYLAIKGLGLVSVILPNLTKTEI